MILFRAATRRNGPIIVGLEDKGLPAQSQTFLCSARSVESNSAVGYVDEIERVRETTRDFTLSDDIQGDF